MFRKIVWVPVVLIALFLAACQPAASPTEAPTEAPTEVMEAPTEAMEMPTEDSMGDDMMEETPMDDSMMEETPMDDGMMDETPMAGDMTEEGMSEDMTPVTFVVRIENVGAADGLTVLSPGAYELNDHPLAFFTPGEADRGMGLEALAEDGNPSVLVDTINEMMAGDMMSFESDVFNTPVGADSPGPAAPGSAYEFTIQAYDGQYLTFATMFVQSNDWFFSPGPDGIALFDADGNPISGDITDQIFLWDAGTEVDQTPGEGADQAPRQAGPNTGEDENGVVEQVMWDDYGILVTITPQQ